MNLWKIGGYYFKTLGSDVNTKLREYWNHALIYIYIYILYPKKVQKFTVEYHMETTNLIKRKW